MVTAATTVEDARKVVTDFFDAYRARDVERMMELCDENAEFHYVPIETWTRQRVIRGDGKVHTIGKVIWTTLIDSFPDLTNTVTSMTASEDGQVAVEVVISGTQAKPFGEIANQGRHYALPHLFLFRTVGDGRIGEVTAYWDTADWYRQLGWMEVD